MERIAIIGGGAAGIMAAAALLEGRQEIQVDLFEKNSSLGVKVAISGGGRCNVTTGITDKNLLLAKYVRGGKFLIPALSAFPPDKVRVWFESHGIPLKIEKDLRVFPVSDRGQDIVELFGNLFLDKRINIHYLEGVIDVKSNKQGFTLKTKKGEYQTNYLLLTTGGNAYRHTGSSGDGYAFAKELGHTITPLGPSLNSFEVKEKWCKELSGISFQDSKLEVTLNDGEKRFVYGPALFTHFGVSGPAVFAMAAHVAFERINLSEPLVIRFIPYSKETFDSWDLKIRKGIEENPTKLILNILKEFLPARFVETIISLTNISSEKKAADLSKEERKSLVHLLTGDLKITLLARRPGDEFVTAGGITLSEVNNKTMQSKLNKQLYFAGEILDIDGLTGGFNLQAAWSTGRTAAKAILNSLPKLS